MIVFAAASNNGIDSNLTVANNSALTESSSSSSCISYDSSERAISITCKTSTLTDIYNQINDKNVLDKETPDGVWLLNAGIVIEHDAKLVIDERDTRWLKMMTGQIRSSNVEGDTNDDSKEGEGVESAYAIRVHGSLNIDSVKITSWDPDINGFIRFESDILPGREFEHTGIDAIPRPYIRIEDDATGTTNITNSEIAYLGYECGGGCSGISYYGQDGDNRNDDNDNAEGTIDNESSPVPQGTSILSGNHIHHNRFGFYSVGIGNMILENNHVHHNFMYGFDPHTGTHDMIIRNNTVHDHGAMGIICSLDCHNILIENNTVSNSAGSGIMFSRNMTNSIARNNYVHDEEQCIFVSQSHGNEVYNNTVTNCGNGIYLKSESSDNSVFNNTIENVNGSAILLNDGASDNSVYSNTIVNPSSEEEAINNEEQEDNIFENNQIIQSPSSTLTSNL